MARRSRKRREEDTTEEDAPKSGININLDLSSKNGMKLVGAAGCLLGAVLVSVFGGEQAHLAGWLVFAAIMVWID